MLLWKYSESPRNPNPLPNVWCLKRRFFLVSPLWFAILLQTGTSVLVRRFLGGREPLKYKFNDLKISAFMLHFIRMVGPVVNAHDLPNILLARWSDLVKSCAKLVPILTELKMDCKGRAVCKSNGQTGCSDRP